MPKCTGYRLLNLYQIWPYLGLSGTETNVHIDVRTGVVQIDSGRPGVGSVVETRTPDRHGKSSITVLSRYEKAGSPAYFFNDL